MTKREEAIERLGVPRCVQCGTIGEALARVIGHTAVGAQIVHKECCSARCAVALLDSMSSGTARIANQKRTGVIALKQAGRQVGIWPRGRKRLAIEAKKAARDA